MRPLLRFALFWSVDLVLHGQQLPYPTYLTPQVSFVGSGPTTLALYNEGYPAGLTAFWNGSPRPTAPGTSPQGYTVSLTAADLSAPQLAVITMVNVQSGAVVDTVNCPVGYNVQPTGVAFDSIRNRLYLATPPTSGDPQFPINSVVALDIAKGIVVATLQADGPLGDLALSDDGSALYVVVEADNAVKRIDPGSFAAVSSFTFRPAAQGYTPLGPVGRDVISVMPGQPATVALGFAPVYASSGFEVAIFDNGIPRPNVLASSCCVLFSPDGKYVFENGSTYYMPDPNAGGSLNAVLRYSVDSTGIPKQTPPAAAGQGASVISGGILYTSEATAIDYQSMQLTGNFGISGPIAVQAANQRAFILYGPPDFDDEGDHPPNELVAFALPSLEAIGTSPVGVSSITSLNPSEQLIPFWSDGFIIPSTAGLLIFHTPLADPAPATTAAGVANAAGQQAGSIAPGEILSIYGTNLGPATPVSAPGGVEGFPSLLSNVEVWFGDLPGVLLLAYQGQINAIAPFELQAGAMVNLQVSYYGIPSIDVPLTVVPAAQALFTQICAGTGPVAVVNQDGSVNTASPAGSIVSLYGTGGGIVSGAVDGELARAAVNYSGPVTVTIAGRNAIVSYAGSAPGLVNGAFQLNVQIPAGVPSGQAAITVSINGQSSTQGATLEIR